MIAQAINHNRAIAQAAVVLHRAKRSYWARDGFHEPCTAAMVKEANQALSRAVKDHGEQVTEDPSAESILARSIVFTRLFPFHPKSEQIAKHIKMLCERCGTQILGEADAPKPPDPG